VNSGQQDKIGFSRQLMSIFYKDAKKAVVTLKETITNGDIKLFTTTIHAMKSALANIGENEISELAFTLERAGLNGDKEFIAANTGNFIERLESLISSISPAETDPGADINAIEDTAFLKEQLQYIQSACDSFDRKAAFAALDLLIEKQWKAKTQAALENIRELISLHSDFDEAAERVQIFIEKNRI
jgi:HPt (histidine-containing phosphotransfer) domain-containing protein